MNKKLVSLSLLVAASMVSLPALATTASVTKTATPQTITIYSNGSGIPSNSYFSLLSPDFPSGGVLSKTKTLTNVAYSIAAYPSASTDTIQLCYYRPYAAAASLCQFVASGSTSSTTAFNSFTFGAGVELRIIHTATGTPGSLLKPSRQESVTITYSY